MRAQTRTQTHTLDLCAGEDVRRNHGNGHARAPHPRLPLIHIHRRLLFFTESRVGMNKCASCVFFSRESVMFLHLCG